jgi:hypothetical protein
MTKFIFLSLLFSISVYAQETERILFKQFLPTEFGVKSRTHDTKDAEALLKSINDFQSANPKLHIRRIEVLTCSSDFELPVNSITGKKVNENLQLAKERSEMIKSEVTKTLKSQIEFGSRICGPKYIRQDDFNDRFVTKESGSIYTSKFKTLLNDDIFLQKLREEALIEAPESLMSLYPTPFLAKFKPFQGIRIIIWGSAQEVEKIEKTTAPTSGKNQ